MQENNNVQEPQTPGPAVQPPNSIITPSANQPIDQLVEPVPPTPPLPPRRKSKKFIMILLAVLLVAGGGAAAWYVTQKDDKKDSSSSVKETQDIPLLRVGSGEGPASAYFPDETLNGVENILNRQLYEGLVGLEGSKIVPFIAQTWTNPDEKTWVFKIRPGVKFHTGNPVTAKEVKASLDDLSKYDYWSLFTSTIESTTVTGELELTIKTKEPDALLLNRLVQAYVVDLTAADKVGNNGTGPYQVDRSGKNDEVTSTLVAFDDYYGGHVKTRKLVYTIYNSDDELVKAFKAKKIDVVETLPIPSVKQELEGAGYASLEFESPGTFGLYMNQRRSANTILKNKDIRMAIAQAMDRQGLIDKVGNKNTPQTQVIPKSLPGYDESISFPTFNLTAAKATLAKSGYNNQPLEFVYIKDLQADAPIIIEQLKALGLNIKERQYVPDDTDNALAELRAGNFDLFTAGFTSDISDARDLLGALVSSTESTYPIYENAEYDKLLTDSDKTFDPTDRIKLLQQANKHIADNIAWIPLRNGNYVAYFSQDVDMKIEFNGGGSVGVYFRKVGRIVN